MILLNFHEAECLFGATYLIGQRRWMMYTYYAALGVTSSGGAPGDNRSRHGMIRVSSTSATFILAPSHVPVRSRLVRDPVRPRREGRPGRTQHHRGSVANRTTAEIRESIRLPSSHNSSGFLCSVLFRLVSFGTRGSIRRPRRTQARLGLCQSRHVSSPGDRFAPSHIPTRRRR